MELAAPSIILCRNSLVHSREGVGVFAGLSVLGLWARKLADQLLCFSVTSVMAPEQAGGFS